MNNNYSLKDKETDWNNPNKTSEQKELLKFRGSLLNQRMAYPLDYKLRLAKRRIETAISEYGKDNCYISFSGGKDSTILSHIVLSLGYKLEHVFSNTRLEYHILKIYATVANMQQVAYGSHSGEADGYSMYA